MSATGMTGEELAQRCLREQGDYAKARSMVEKSFVLPEVKAEAGKVLDRWEREGS